MGSLGRNIINDISSPQVKRKVQVSRVKTPSAANRSTIGSNNNNSALKSLKKPKSILSPKNPLKPPKIELTVFSPQHFKPPKMKTPKVS